MSELASVFVTKTRNYILNLISTLKLTSLEMTFEFENESCEVALHKNIIVYKQNNNRMPVLHIENLKGEIYSPLIEEFIELEQFKKYYDQVAKLYSTKLTRMPAILMFHNDGTIMGEVYYKKGKINNVDNHPAITKYFKGYNPSCSICKVNSYTPVHHNCTNSYIKTWVKGGIIEDKEMCNFVSRTVDGVVTYEWLLPKRVTNVFDELNKRQLHRPLNEGPAKMIYRNGICSLTEYHLDGKYIAAY